MRRDTRLSRMLHLLIHMDRHQQRATSETIAEMLGTNAVVVRRMMAGLRDRGYVSSRKGHGGGWELTRDLGEITLLDVYAAIGEPPLFAIGPSADRPQCLVEQAAEARLEATLNEARALVERRLAEVTVGDIADDFDHRWTAQTGTVCAGTQADER